MLGPDGSGKTTQSELLLHAFIERGYTCKGVHLIGPPLLKNFTKKQYGILRNHFLPKAMLDEKKSQVKEQTDKFSSCVWFVVSLIDAWIDFVSIILRGHSDVILQDRVFFQKIIYCFSEFPLWVIKLYIRLFPRPSIIYYFDLSPEIAFKRKGEDSIEELLLQKKVYEKMLPFFKNKLITVNANQSPDALHRGLLEKTISLLKAKNE